jgi:hypothetical protein
MSYMSDPNDVLMQQVSLDRDLVDETLHSLLRLPLLHLHHLHRVPLLVLDVDRQFHP